MALRPVGRLAARISPVRWAVFWRLEQLGPKPERMPTHVILASSSRLFGTQAGLKQLGTPRAGVCIRVAAAPPRPWVASTRAALVRRLIANVIVPFVPCRLRLNAGVFVLPRLLLVGLALLICAGRDGLALRGVIVSARSLMPSRLGAINSVIVMLALLCHRSLPV